MLPPSATLAVALSDTVVVSMVSVMPVLAGVALTARFSKLPPVADAIERCTLPASRTTSSVGAGRLVLPLLAPAAIVMTAPLSSVTLTAVNAALVSDAV